MLRSALIASALCISGCVGGPVDLKPGDIKNLAVTGIRVATAVKGVDIIRDGSAKKGGSVACNMLTEPETLDTIKVALAVNGLCDLFMVASGQE